MARIAGVDLPREKRVEIERDVIGQTAMHTDYKNL